MPSQHVINAIAKVSAVYTRDSDKWHHFKTHSSLRYDDKSMTLDPDCQSVSLLVCPKGRITSQLQMSAGMRKQLQQGEVGSAELVYRKGNFYLHISITVPAPEVKQHGEEYPPQKSPLQKEASSMKSETASSI